MKLIRKIVSVLFASVLLFSATTTSSIAIDKLHFVIGGGAGGGWDGTARGTGEALTKSGMIKSASYENMSGGGGGTRSPRICSSTHTPRITGLVRYGKEVLAKVADIPRIPPRFGFVSLTLCIFGPRTDCLIPYTLASDSFTKV